MVVDGWSETCCSVQEEKMAMVEWRKDWEGKKWGKGKTEGNTERGK